MASVQQFVGSVYNARGVIKKAKADEALSEGELCFVDSSGRFGLADSNVEAKTPAVGVATRSISSKARGPILLSGAMRSSRFNFTPGQPIFLGGTPGEITQVAPSGSGDTVQALGWATDVDEIVFQPSLVTLKLS